jgi:hypothetical protein
MRKGDGLVVRILTAILQFHHVRPDVETVTLVVESQDLWIVPGNRWQPDRTLTARLESVQTTYRAIFIGMWGPPWREWTEPSLMTIAEGIDSHTCRRTLGKSIYYGQRPRV